jgi:hypothetical protein
VRLNRVIVRPNPDVLTEELTFEVDRNDEFAWSELVEYVDRLIWAGMVDEWEVTAIHMDTSQRVLQTLKNHFGTDLEVIETGYEERTAQ